jgi:sirohydrochlorin ferrochelatase
MQALLFICHGSRLKKGCMEAKNFVSQCIEDLNVPIKEICFLELSEPSIANGYEACIKKGATRIAVVPVLLLSANHAKHDIPAELTLMQAKYPEVELTYGNPFGVHESLSKLLWEKITEKVKGLKDTSHVLLIGRGSTDPDVKRDLSAIASHLQKSYNVPSINVCFLTGSKPSFDDALSRIEPKYDQLILVPYLLFSGLLMNGIQKSIIHFEKDKEKEVLLCNALGFHPILKEVLHTRIYETIEKERDEHVSYSFKSS